MTKTEFLQQLYDYLLPLAAVERDEIMADFEEHFQAGAESGKTEEQICAELGDPAACAQPYLRHPEPFVPPQQPPQPPRPEPEKAGRAAALDQRNRLLWSLTFAFFVICAFGVYPAAVSLMAMPLVVLLVAIFAVAFVPTAAMIGFMISLSVFSFSAGLLLFLLMTWLLKLSYKRAGF